QGEKASLLANYTNNNLEWFSQYNVRFTPGHYAYLSKSEQNLIEKLKTLQEDRSADTEAIEKTEKQLAHIRQELEKWSPENFKKLEPRLQNLHSKGLATNHEAPHYHETETLTYTDETGNEKQLKAPKGDVFHEFR